MDAFRTTPFHRALHRPQQILGAERNLVLSTGLACAVLAIPSMSLSAAAVAAAIWFLALQVFRRMAKADPDLSSVYRRQLRFAAYYAPFSRPWRKASSRLTY
jgi:type IV secretion system protein VirB3